ncbi:adenosylcobinamide-phosphate synthase CbiB [Chitinasiproducens palmae]
MGLACLLDRWLGDPRRGHPVALFGRYATAVERCCRGRRTNARALRLAGLLAWALAVLPPVLLAAWLAPPRLAAISGTAIAGALPGWLAHWQMPIPLAIESAVRDTFSLHGVFAIACLYFALGARSLAEHGRAVADALAAGRLAEARVAVSMIVSRDTRALDQHAVSAAAVESMLENGSDAVFAALFWFAVAGAPGVVLHRCANTLDAMWGYRNARYHAFGWTAARIDDVLNYVPARLTALTYAVLGRTRLALACWRTQAPAWDSPNAGPVMAAGAGALGVRLGGDAVYFGRRERRPTLGKGRVPVGTDIERAIRLVTRGIGWWLMLCVLASLAIATVASTAAAATPVPTSARTSVRTSAPTAAATATAGVTCGVPHA